MTAPQTYVVQSAIWVTWGGEQYFVGPRTLIAAVPGSTLYNAYGGANGNLKPLPGNQQGDDADHAETGN
jgi:hypothetical protein